MGVRSPAQQSHAEMSEREAGSHSSPSLVTSLMKSWKISSSSKSSPTSSSSNASTVTMSKSRSHSHSHSNSHSHSHSNSHSHSKSSHYSSPLQNYNSSSQSHRQSMDSLDSARRHSNNSTPSLARKYSSGSNDGNFDAMSRQQSASIKKNHHSSYSPLRYISPSMTNLESPRPSFFRQQHVRKTHHNQYYHNTGATSTTTTTSNNYGNNSGDFDRSVSNFSTNDSVASFDNNNNNSKYFQDLDEDWSAVIDDYNAPIPVLLNGGKGESASLSRISTSSSQTNLKNSLQYPQLPILETRSQEEIDNEKEVQELNAMMQRINKFDSIINSTNIIDLQKLRQLSWNGIPKPNRPIVWKLLIGYLPANKNRQKTFLKRKRQEYRDGLEHTFSKEHQRDIPTWHQIEIDIPRTNPHIPLYQFKTVHDSLQKILYLWAIRHPASGYVQGINDLVTPFFQTFLTEYLPQSQLDDIEKRDPMTYLTEQQLRDVEADTFWCLTKLLEQITDNYIHGQPGILKQVKNLSQLVKRIDLELFNHFQKENVEFIQFAFRWMNCLLMREFQMNIVIRIWDTYLSETSLETTSSLVSGGDMNSPQTPLQKSAAAFTTPTNNNISNNNLSPMSKEPTRSTSVSTLTASNNKDDTSSPSTNIKQSSLNEFHVFVCAAFLIKWSDALCNMDFQEIITFLQNPPTKDWNEADIEMLLSEAYIWQSLYKDATSHWQ